MAYTSKVSGVVQVDGAPARRIVRAFGYTSKVHNINGEPVTLSQSLGDSTSNRQTGEYTIDLLSGYSDQVFVVAFDDYGEPFTPDKTVVFGDRIHPSAPNGHIFEVTGAGTLPTAEPTWIVDTETSQAYGTATMIARPFYRPMVHGPVAPELTEVEDPSGPWTPAELFKNSEAGAWYDPSDITTLYQDATGYTAVTKDGDPVALMLDKSGNGQHLFQTVLFARPTFRTDGIRSWLEFNGAEQFMEGASVPVFDGDFTAVYATQASELERLGVVFATSDVSDRIVGFLDTRERDDIRLGGVEDGSWLNIPSTPGLAPHVFRIEREGLLSRGSIDVTNAYPSPQPVSALLALNNKFVLGRQQGVNTFILSGRIYGLIATSLMTTENLNVTRQYLNGKSGI